MEIQKLLPIGSIVLLKDGQKRLMIGGVMQTAVDEGGKEYDYFGLLYPEGYMGEDFQYLFNHEDIERVEFRGYEDAERAAFIRKLDELYAAKDR